MFCRRRNLEIGRIHSGRFESNRGVPEKSRIFWGGMQIVKTILVKNKLVNLIVKPAK